MKNHLELLAENIELKRRLQQLEFELTMEKKLSAFRADLNKMSEESYQKLLTGANDRGDKYFQWYLEAQKDRLKAHRSFIDDCNKKFNKATTNEDTK